MATVLPKTAAAAVSAEIRLAYVLHHFRHAYAGASTISIGYAAQQPQIEVAEGANGFFEQHLPYPSAPIWREWGGQRLPFFFDLAPDKPLLELLTGGRVVIHADVISAAFYLLSGWQEYFSEERDRHGRFPFSASVQHQYSFVTVPVVNYYFDVLRAAVEHALGQPLQPFQWMIGAPFAVFVTHDIDNLFSSWKAPAKAALKSANLLRFSRMLWKHLTQPDAWNNLEAVADSVTQHGGRSTFFVLPSSRKAPNGTPNADYRLTPHLHQRLRQLQKRGCELGLHGSIGTTIDAIRLTYDLDATQYAGSGLRFHYLMWEPRSTPTLVDTVGFDYDSTLGFAEHFGFRNSYCLPFYLFNFERGEASGFLEIPLNVMDATLHHPNYLQLAPDEVLPALTPMFQEIERFGGVCAVLWHNENFDPANTRNGPQQFREVMNYLRDRGAAFVTGREVVELFAACS